MREDEILNLWSTGLSKNKVAEIYRRRYNETIKIIRLEMHNRHKRKVYKQLWSIKYSRESYI